MAITKTATRDLTTAIAGAIWSRIQDSDNRRLEEEAGVDPAVKKARRDLDKEDPTETKVYDKDLRGLISKVFGRMDVQVSQTEGKVDNLSNKVSAVGGEIVNTQQMIINQNEMLEAKFDELLEVLGVKKDQDDDKKTQKEFDQLELELDQVVSGGSGSTSRLGTGGKGSESYSGLVNWFKVKSYEMMHRVVRRAWKSRFFRKPRALYRLGRKKIFDAVTSAASTRTGKAILPQILRGKAGRRLLQTALGRGAGRLVPIASTALAADDVARYSKKGDWLGMSLAFIDMVASGTEGAYATGAGAPVGAVASVIANIAGGALTVYEIAQILTGGDPYSTKGVLPFETGTAKQPSFGGIIAATSPIVSVVRSFGEKSGYSGQVEALISQAGLSDTPSVDVSHSFTVGGGVSAAASIDPTSIVGKAPEIMSPLKKEELGITDTNNQGENNSGEGGSGSTPTTTMLSRSTPKVSIDASGESGVDFTPHGPNNRVLFAGTVTEIGHQYNPHRMGGDNRMGSGYGNYVVVTSIDPSNGKEFDGLYAHFPKDSIAVRQGDYVEYGDILGPMATVDDYANPETRREVGSGTGPHTSFDALEKGTTRPYSNWRNLMEHVDPSFSSKKLVSQLTPTPTPGSPDTISSLNSVESPIPNIVSEGSMNRHVNNKQSRKRSSIVIINNQIIKTSNLTVPVGSQSESGDFFPAYNLARLG